MTFAMASDTRPRKGPVALSRAVAEPSTVVKLNVLAVAVLLSTSAPTAAPLTKYEDTAGHSARSADAFHSGGIRRRRRHEEALRRIEELSGYEAGWNGSQGASPTVQTVAQAKDFAFNLLQQGDIAAPHISLADDGEINFYWKTAALVMDLGFSGINTFSYFAQSSDGRIFVEDAAAIGDRLPADLLALLRS